MKSKVLPVVAAALAVASGVTVVRLLDTGAGKINPHGCDSQSPRRRQFAPGRVIDISATYGRVSRTVFNKKTRIVFANPQEFFSDSGVQSFENLRFDDLRRLPTGLSLVDGRRLTREDIELIESKP